MSKIYENQESLRLTLQTGVDISGANAQVIKYLKPDDTEGEFAAVIDGTNDLYYDFAANDLDQVGDWTFWAFVTFSDNRTAPGQPVTIRVYEEGN